MNKLRDIPWRYRISAVVLAIVFFLFLTRHLGTKSDSPAVDTVKAKPNVSETVPPVPEPEAQSPVEDSPRPKDAQGFTEGLDPVQTPGIRFHDPVAKDLEGDALAEASAQSQKRVAQRSARLKQAPELSKAFYTIDIIQDKIQVPKGYDRKFISAYIVQKLHHNQSCIPRSLSADEADQNIRLSLHIAAGGEIQKIEFRPRLTGEKAFSQCLLETLDNPKVFKSRQNDTKIILIPIKLR